MKVKLLTSLSGKDINHSAGEIIDMSTGDAKRMIERNLAEPVKSKKEKATLKNDKNALL